MEEIIHSTSKSSRPPPRLHFDDGSRIMSTTCDNNASDAATYHHQQPNKNDQSSCSFPCSARGNVPIETYYEIDRVAREVVEKLDWSHNSIRGRLWRKITIFTGANAEGSEETTDEKNADQNGKKSEDDGDGFLCRVALQFPDELLPDATEVCWLIEEAISVYYREKLFRPFEDVLNNALKDEKRSKLEQEADQHSFQMPLVFILGDTTYGSCCPDEVSAKHLNANVIIHFGYSCLAPTESIPVVYTFGISEMNEAACEECASLVLRESGANSSSNDGDFLNESNADKPAVQTQQKKLILLLYEVKYHHAMNHLRAALERTGRISVSLGEIPKQQLRHNPAESLNTNKCGSLGRCVSSSGSETAISSSTSKKCCQSNDKSGDNPNETHSIQSCCNKIDSCSDEPNNCNDDTGNQTISNPTPPNCRDPGEAHYIPRTIGGLEIPEHLDLSNYTLLYIGDDLDNGDGDNAHTRFLHIMLRCAGPDGTHTHWAYSPLHHRFYTDILGSTMSSSMSVSTLLSRTLRRRYYLLQRAKLATTIAILIGTTSTSYSFRRLLFRTRSRIKSSGRTAYTFVVGKLSTSPSKLANFAEIDCFVLIACGESIAKFWRMEREEMLVPVITPMELDVALGLSEWDGRYSCDFGDLIRWDREKGAEDIYNDGDCNFDDDAYCQSNLIKNSEQEKEEDGNDSSDDEPFFSLISGKYEQSRATSISNQKGADLEALPGKGQLTEYRSEAAEFLKRREYKGLEANIGQTEVKSAVLGKVGIASDYGHR